jgi:two-component system response regulator AtoC
VSSLAEPIKGGTVTFGDTTDPPSGPGCEKGDLDGVRVLLVDDDLETRIVFALLLESFGADVHAAAGVEESLEAFETFGPHIVVTDIDLAGESGLSLVDELHRRGESTPVIAVSAVGNSVEALAHGCQAYFHKPVSWHGLAEAIRGAVPLRSVR